jgi:hypothetical protein
MRFANYWRQMWMYVARQRRARRPARSLRLRVEALEDRTVPSIVWSSSGSRNVQDQGGPVITHADVDLIFWGSGWNNNPALMTNVTNSVNSIMNSPYLSGLSQYRGIGSGQLYRTDFITGTSPAAHTTIAQYDAFVRTNLNNGALPVTPSMDSQILYMVIPQPGTTDPAEGAGGAHGTDLSSFGRFHYGWSENISSLDDITNVVSHELTETVTDPEVNFHNAFVVPTTHDELCDGEAQNYSYRLNGVLVQSSLSQSDHAYDVYDGNVQKFVLTSGRALTVNGDQLTNPDDTITIDTIGSGYVINLNGEVAHFDAGQVNSITVNSRTGNNTINIERTVAGRPVTINLDSGTDTVNLSPTAQNLSNLAGTVTVNGGSGTGTLVANDQGTSTARTYTLTSSTLVRSGAATITYNNLAGVTVNTSNGSDTVTVQSTSAVTAVTVNGGTGTNTLVGSNNTADAWAVTGSNSGTLSSGTILGQVSFSGFQNLTGGNSTNYFTLSDQAGVSGNISGGGGGTLDLSAYSTTVVVDLQTRVSTGVGGSISNIQNVLGGNGGGAGTYNILVGNGGNVLTGGFGRRNLLIAGGSASTLIGGDDDDILIAGTTAYDREAGLVSLNALMAYWSGTADDYPTRVGNVTTGNGVPLLDGTTVTSNGGGNTLLAQGGGPTEMNLYYANPADTIDATASETVIAI